MTLTQYQKNTGLTWQQLAHQLTAAAREHGDEPIYYHRLWRLRTGKSRATQADLRALAVVTGDDVQSYR